MLEGSVRDQGVCACLCVSSTSTFCDCSVERMAWDIYGLELSLLCGWKLLSALVTVLCFGLLTELRNGSIHLGWGTPFGVKFLDLSGWDRLVGLASGTIHGLDPQDAVLLIIAGKHHSVAFLYRIEESPATIQAWEQHIKEQVVSVLQCVCTCTCSYTIYRCSVSPGWGSL